MKHLFIDSFIIEEMENAKQVLSPVKKYEGNPVLLPDKKWEGGWVQLYGTVLYSEEEKVFKMWYLSKGGVWNANYATSKDGIIWQKPNLGLNEFEGSNENNIVLLGADLPNVVYSPEDPDLNRRYKMSFYTGHRYTTEHYWVAFSPDGIHWGDPIKAHYLWGMDVIYTCYDETSGRYLAFLRADYPYIRGFQRRVISLTVSMDFVNWRQPGMVLVPDEVDDHVCEKYLQERRDVITYDDPQSHRAEFYGMPVFTYEGMYLGLLQMFYSSWGPDDPHPRGAQDGLIDVQLVSSRDLIHWQRLGDRKPIISLGKPGEWDCGIIHTANTPIIVGDEIWIYYSGCSHGHGCPPSKRSEIAIGLAKLRLDGFVSVDAGATEGTLTTKQMVLDGDELVINASAKEGSVAVEILDGEGNPIPGFKRDSCDVFSDDQVRHAVTWKGSSSLSKLKGTTIKLRFYLRKAKLYSFTLPTKPTKPSYSSTPPTKQPRGYPGVRKLE